MAANTNNNEVRITLEEWSERREREMEQFLDWCHSTNARTNTEADWALLYSVYVTMKREAADAVAIEPVSRMDCGDNRGF